jgi:ABC-type multidrug transport system fused ATPase/permease subunit
MNRKNIKRFLFWIRLKKVFDLLPKRLKRLSIFFFAIILITSLLDLLGIALFIPLLLLLLEDDYINKHEAVSTIYHFLNFDSPISFTIFLLLSIFILIVLKNITSIILTRKQTLFALILQTDISALVLKNYFNRSILDLKKKNSNQVVWEINSLPSQFTRSLLLPLGTFLNELLVAIIIGIGLFLFDPRIIFLLSISVVPVTFLFYRFTKRKVQALQQRQALLIPMLNTLAQQSIFGIIDVILTNTKNLYLKNYNKLLNESKYLNTALITYMSIPAKIIEVAIISAITLLIIVGLKSGIEKKETLTFLGVFALAAYRLIPSFNKITVSILSFKSYQYTLNFLSRSLRNIKPETLEDEISSIPIDFNHSMKIENLSFEYKKNQPIIHNISLEISKGETVGIIGKSGSGKTTLMNIFLGLLDNYEGVIKIDNHILSKANLQSWHKKVGYVQQNIFLLDSTIKENIAFGIEPNLIDDTKIKTCIEAANLTELITNLPFGLDTKVGELGNAISGGQKQRIGIARALYSDAEILFFDEATSALDKETESQITDTLKSLSTTNAQLTMIVIAHRYSTLEHCDRIIELDNGKISSIKNFNELKN